MSKKSVIAAALVAAGIVAIYGVYQFQATRFTPLRLKSVDLAKERVVSAEQVEKKAQAAKEAAKEGRPEPPVRLNEVGEVPKEFDVQYHTTAGDIVIRYHSDWSPFGVERIYKLVKIGYYDDSVFFRVVPGFVVQWGLASKPDKTQAWLDQKLPAESPKMSNIRGTVSFAMGGSPNTRSVQLFINTGNNARLDEMSFAPIGEVIKGMDVVDKLNAIYNESPTARQEEIIEYGNVFLDEAFPGLDRIKWAVVLKNAAPEAKQEAAPSVPAPAQGK